MSSQIQPLSLISKFKRMTKGFLVWTESRGDSSVVRVQDSLIRDGSCSARHSVDSLHSDDVVFLEDCAQNLHLHMSQEVLFFFFSLCSLTVEIHCTQVRCKTKAGWSGVFLAAALGHERDHIATPLSLVVAPPSVHIDLIENRNFIDFPFKCDWMYNVLDFFFFSGSFTKEVEVLIFTSVDHAAGIWNIESIFSAICSFSKDFFVIYVWFMR